MTRDRLYVVAAVLLTLLGAARIASTWRVFSQTNDEPAHLATGFEWLTRGTYVLDVEHPPLARALFALDAAIDKNAKVSREDTRTQQGNELLLRNEQHLRNLSRMRAGNLPFFFLAAAIVFIWARRDFDGPTALLALAMFAALPPILAHAGLATTDMAVTALTVTALYALDRWLREPSLIYAAALGVAVGLGLLSKFSFVPFFGAGAIVFLMARRPRRVAQLALSTVVAFFVLWAGYRFSIGKLNDARLAAFPSDSFPHLAARYASAPGYDWVRPEHIGSYRAFADETQRTTGYAGIDFVDWAKAAGYPSPLAGRSGSDTMSKAPPLPPPDAVTRTLEPLRRARQWIVTHVPLPAPMFLAGLEWLRYHASTGHPAYLLGKRSNTGWWYYFPVVLFFKTPLPFSVFAILGTILLARRHPIAFAPAAMLVPALISKINIGVRHVLPLYPLLAISAAVSAVWLWRRAGAARVAAALLLMWFFVSTTRAHPDYLAWFNELAGDDPAHIAVDSNLDWGQDLFRLRDENLDNLHFKYFGSADWHRHGLRGTEMPRGERCIEGRVAISEMELRIGYGYEWLERYEPVRRIGKSIRLYEIDCP